MLMRSLAASVGLATAAVTLSALVACSSTTIVAATPDAATDDAALPEPDPQPEVDASPPVEAGPPPFDPGPDPLAACTRDPGAPTVMVNPTSATDPIGGADKFTLGQALAGFPAGTGKLTAAIATDVVPTRVPGTYARRLASTWITCELLEKDAPISVANFIGLARATRPYQLANKWKVGRFYDGLTWHRVIPGFVVQGGDPDGDGTGGPGYDLVVENQVDEPAGVLAMAAGMAPSGSQFYVVVGRGPAAKYNVFGTCTLPTAIAISRVARDRQDAPKKPVHILKVEIARCP